MKLSKTTSLPEYQKLVRQLVVERGFDKETVTEVFMLLVEEIGELGKAIRKSSGMKVDEKSHRHDFEEEAADVLWLLIDLCNRLDINLQKAFFKKQKKTSKRKRS